MIPVDAAKRIAKAGGAIHAGGLLACGAAMVLTSSLLGLPYVQVVALVLLAYGANLFVRGRRDMEAA